MLRFGGASQDGSRGDQDEKTDEIELLMVSKHC
jgi:hypothetical protein